MKKKFAIIPLLMMSYSLFSQQNEPSKVLTKEDYLRKSRHQRTAGAILVSCGTISYMVGTVVALREAGDDISRGIGGIFDPNIQPRKSDQGAINTVFITGTVEFVTGIVLFIAAGNNRRKAKKASVSFKPERIFQLQKSNLVSTIIPSVSLRISL